MRQFALLALITMCMATIACGSRDQVYEEPKRPTQTVADVTVSLISFRQEEDHVAFRIKVDNKSSKQIAFFARSSALPFFDGVQVLADGHAYATMPAPNELPAEDFAEHLYSTSGMRMMRDLTQVGDRAALVIDANSFKRYDLKAMWSTLNEGKEKPNTTPWTLNIVLADNTGAALGEVKLTP